ncbi:MAG: replication initiation protein [Acutalibacteraceae bacterium]|nr:replication initiation protein [Acutalibacteraceae bacterium]
MSIEGNEIVEKSCALNKIRLTGMTLQELRFLSIYLAKINSKDESTKKVTFPLEDFQKIMNLGRMNIHHFQQVTNSLLCKVYNQPSEDGGYVAFTLFKRCRVYKNKNDKWFIEIEASDDALPLMFNIRGRYLKYELWNALSCKSANQVLMYELLKSQEKNGRVEIKVSDLRSYLNIGNKEYIRWNNFKARVLDSCQKALELHTDIKFTYERGEYGVGGKWLSVVFYIQKNENYFDHLAITDYIDLSAILDELE